MKLKRFLAAFTAFSMLFMCSGCSLNLFSTDTLLRPPVLSGKSGEVQEAFNKLMSGKPFVLKTPTKGEYKSSFVLYDIDGDKEEESLVFYADTSNDTTVRIAILDCVNDTWIVSADIKGSGSGVYDVSFPDLNNDSVAEIVIAWSLFDNKLTKMATVYKTNITENGVFEIQTLANEYFNAKTFVDLNSNGSDDLILIYLDDAGEIQNSYFRAFSLERDTELIKFSELLLDSSITSVSSINSDLITDGEEGYARVFIDCLKTDTNIFTEVISWNSDKLKAERIVKKASQNTLRNLKISSKDIDNDGNLEVPVITKFFTEEKSSTVVISGVVYNFTMIKWLNIDGDESKSEIKTLHNPFHSYLFVFPWEERVTVNFDKIENQTNFCLWNSTTKEIEDILFSIKFVENKVNEEKAFFEDLSDENVLKTTENGTFYYEITNYGEDYGITEEILESSFILI